MAKKSDFVIADGSGDQNMSGLGSMAMGMLGGIDPISDIAPMALGTAGALGATILMRKFVDPTSPVQEFAPLIGSLGGVALSVPLAWTSGGTPAAVRGALYGVAVGGGLFAWEQMRKRGFVSGVSGLGLIDVQRRQLGAPVASGGGARVLPTANVPRQVKPAMDIAAFGARPT